MLVPKRPAVLILMKALALLVALPIFYLVAGIVGSLIPANPDWKEPAQGVTIFVRTNGVHTWLVVPKVSEEMDWRAVADPRHLKDPRYGWSNHLAFGFGNRDFYLNTPTWDDLTVSTTLAAAFGRGPGLVHVEHVHDPQSDAYTKPLRISGPEFSRLTRFIKDSFVLDQAGRPVPVLGKGYSGGDAFYEGRGKYNMARTCNEWTGEGLRTSGIKAGVWTPFSQSIMWRLDEA